MLSIKDIRDRNEYYRNGFIKRGIFEGDITLREACDAPEKVSVPVLDEILKLDQERRNLLFQVEDLKRQKNEASKEIGKCKKEGRDTGEIIQKMQELGKAGKENEERLKQVEERIDTVISGIPNILDADVPPGETEEENMCKSTHGTIPEFSFQPKAHHELGEALGMMDLERAGKIAGSRFVVLYDGLALLEWSLMRFMIDIQIKNGYRLTLPPFMVNSQSMFGTGQLPKFEQDLFKCAETDYYLIPTAEVPVTNLHRNEILSETDLPYYYCAYTPNFRSEAGSYGKDIKGFLRQHQFNKVELVKFVIPEKSEEEHENLVMDARKVLDLLELPYRVMLLCSKDTGFSARKCYDIEVWLPGENRYREISSCSNFWDFQSRRANIRFRRESGGKPEFVHTLNGSGLAVGRALIALMENYQQEDGSIKVPEVLKPYVGMDVIKR